MKKKLTMNTTTRVADAAQLISNNFNHSHRGAIRYWNNSSDETFGVVLYGNDGYTPQPDSSPVIDARTKAYVHNLYAGLANLLPEGAVEFGTDKEGYSWAILAHFPQNKSLGDYQDEDADDDDQDGHADDDRMIDFWHDIVWNQWKSQLAFADE